MLPRMMDSRTVVVLLLVRILSPGSHVILSFFSTDTFGSNLMERVVKATLRATTFELIFIPLFLLQHACHLKGIGFLKSFHILFLDNYNFIFS